MARSLSFEPRSSVRHDHEELHIVIPVRRQGFRIVLNGIWFLAWLLVETVLILRLAGVVRLVPDPGMAVLVPLTVLFTAAGAFILWRLLWYIAGREEVRVHGETLAVRRAVGPVGRTRTFDVDRIRNVRAERLDYRVIYPAWGRAFLGHEESSIVFEHDGALYRYGRGLEVREAEYLAEVLREAVGSRPRP